MNNHFWMRSLLILVVLGFFNGTPAALAENAGMEAALSMQKVFVDVARRLKPSVVNIRVERTASGNIQWANPGDEQQGGAEEFFRHFFRGPGLKFNRPEAFKTQAAGSGVVFTASGMILTNNHVVKDASKILVKLEEGSELEAEIVGQDPQTDLAVIKIKSDKKLEAAEFADSDKVEVGQWCIAVGNPLGLEQTVTVGVVSALGRSGIGATAIEDFIQTDASINPGNSGGPLVDLHGRVIGINTLIFNAPGSGIGFAIPAKMASRIATQIASGGKVERPYIGITMQPVTEELAKHFGLQDRDGAVVMQVVPQGPAAISGVKPMDIIRKIDGRQIRSTSDVQKYVLSRELNSQISLELLRNGKIEKVKIKLEQMPDAYGLAGKEQISAPTSGTGVGLAGNLGFSVKKLTAEQAATLGMKDDPSIAVVSIKPGSLADSGGLKTGDIINQINSREINEEKDVETALKEGKKKGSSVFLVNRDGIPMFLVISFDDKN